MVLWIETGEMPFAGKRAWHSFAQISQVLNSGASRRASLGKLRSLFHKRFHRVEEAQNSSMPPVAPSRNPPGIGVRKRGSPMSISIQARISRIHFGICMSQQNWFIQYPNSEVYITERACQSVPMGNMFEYDED